MADNSLAPDVAAEDKGTAIIVSMTSLTAVATLFVVVRLFVRARVLGKIHWDDYLIILSVLLGWINTAMSIVGVQHGSGKHAIVLQPDELSGALYWSTIAFVPGVLSFCFPKLAIVGLLTRLLNPSKIHQIVLWGLAIFATVSLVVSLSLTLTECTPTASMWDYRIPSQSCMDPKILVDFAFFAGCFSAAVDMYLAVYPSIVLFQLHMSMKKKIGLSIALGFGSIAAIVAIYKCTRLPSLASKDFLYDTADLVIWTCVEGTTLIIAACIPIMQPLP